MFASAHLLEPPPAAVSRGHISRKLQSGAQLASEPSQHGAVHQAGFFITGSNTCPDLCQDRAMKTTAESQSMGQCSVSIHFITKSPEYIHGSPFQTGPAFFSYESKILSLRGLVFYAEEDCIICDHLMFGRIVITTWMASWDLPIAW